MDNERTGDECSLGTLIEHLKHEHGRRVVVKYGGNAMINQEMKRNVIQDIVFLKMTGMQPIVVHGGGPAINDHMDRVGLEPTFVDGQRKTDTETLEIVEMVLCGKVNNEMVKLINAAGGKAVGLSGKDLNMITARKHYRERITNGKLKKTDLGRVGEVADINPELMNLLLDHGYIPVIAPIAVGEDDMDYNINADLLAGKIASSLMAENLVFVTDVEGIMKDPSDPKSLITEMNLLEAKFALEQFISGGMTPKIEASIEALERGIRKVYVLNGRLEHAIVFALLTDRNLGTQIMGKKE